MPPAPRDSDPVAVPLPAPRGLDALFRPRAVAVVGASRQTGSVGQLVLKKLLDGGFTGPIYPVNPQARAIASVAAVRDVGELPDEVDLAVIAVPAALVLGVAEACAAKGIGGLVVLSAGFAETGAAGAEAEAALVEAVRARGMRMVGPNCLGLINTDPTVMLDAIFAPVKPLAGSVAMASQSGALGVAILETARELDLGMSSFVSVGNKADVSGNDLLEWWEDDPRTGLILLYLESLGNPQHFATIARRVARKKPILAVKAGRTSAGQRAAGSHTAALAEPERCVDALFTHTGVLRATTLEEMFDAASLLAHQPLPAGNRVAILSNAGGPGILCADACEGARLVVPPLTAATRNELATLLPLAASLGNPIDLGASASAEDYRQALPLLLDDANVDAVIALFVSAGVVDMDAVGAALKEGRAAARSARAKPLLTCFLGQRGVPASLRGAAESVPSYRFPESAARALALAVRRSTWLHEPPGEVPAFAEVDVAAAEVLLRRALAERGPGWLTPTENEALLELFGIPHLPSVICPDADAAVAAAEALGLPVAVKLASTTLVHKSDWNGVHVDLRSPAAVRAAVSAIDAALLARGKSAELLGYMVQPMAGSGVDTMVGMVADPDFGPLVAFGLGGVTMELVGDVAFRLAPLSDREAERMVHSIKSAPLLSGFRGAPVADEAALIDVLLRVAHLAQTLPEVQELDLNPVRVYAAGQGACALDARVRVGGAGSGGKRT